MSKTIKDIYDRNIIHSSFLDERTVKKCMQESYDLGTEELLEWLSKSDLITDKKDVIQEEWENHKTKKNDKKI